MAQTTTHINASDVVVTLDNASGTATDISGSSNTCSITAETETAKTNTFTGNYPLSFTGKVNVTVDLSAVYTTATGEASDILKQWKFGSSYGSSRTLQIDIPDSTSGSDRYSGEFKLGNLAINGDANTVGGMEVTAQLTNDGAFSWTVIA